MCDINSLYCRSLRKLWLVLVRAQNVLTLSRFVLWKYIFVAINFVLSTEYWCWCEWNRSLKMLINHQWALLSLMILKGLFPFKTWHNNLCKILLFLSLAQCLNFWYCRLLEYVAIGPRFSNIISQTLMVLLKRLPPKVLPSPFFYYLSIFLYGWSTLVNFFQWKISNTVKIFLSIGEETSCLWDDKSTNLLRFGWYLWCLLYHLLCSNIENRGRKEGKWSLATCFLLHISRRLCTFEFFYSNSTLWTLHHPSPLWCLELVTWVEF